MAFRRAHRVQRAQYHQHLSSLCTPLSHRPLRPRFVYALRAAVPAVARSHLELAGFISADRLIKFETQNLDVLKKIHTQRTRDLS